MLRSTKIFLLVVVAMTFFTGCFGGVARVGYLEFQSYEGESLIVMKMVPDYTKRTLTVNYRVDSEPVEGLLGGENFDRFEKSVKTVMERDNSGQDGVDSFKVVVKDMDNNLYSFTDKNEEGELLLEMRTFYEDVAEMLTQEEQI